MKKLLFSFILLGFCLLGGSLAFCGCDQRVRASQVDFKPTPSATLAPGMTRVPANYVLAQVAVPAHYSVVEETGKVPVQMQHLTGGQSVTPAAQKINYYVFELTLTPTWTPSPCGYIYIVRSKDTLYSISRQCRVSMWELARVNNIVDINYIRIGQQLTIPSPGPTLPRCDYIVQSGDNLYKLYKRFGPTVEEIARANSLYPPYIIKIGQCLVIPGWATPTPYFAWTPTPYPIWTPIPTFTPIYVPPPRPTTPTVEPFTPIWGTPQFTPTPTIIWGAAPFDSSEGGFSLSYPAGWEHGSSSQAGRVTFWARESTNPLAPMVLVVSKPSVGRDSGSVLQDYKNELPGLLRDILPDLSLRWNENLEPFNLGGHLGKEDYGSARTSAGETRVRLIAATSFELGLEYMVFLSAKPEDWGTKGYFLDTIVNGFRFL
ncbi:MAG: LysM peptidoglycan-binding domain-containing protein [Anaerolineae bacterium]